jgi:hypothetical protein
MKKREAIQLGIDHYDHAIQRIVKGHLGMQKAMDFLFNKSMQQGLCRFYDTRDLQCNWVHKWRVGGKAWLTTPPISCCTRAEIIESLKFRLEILKKELKRSQ